MNDHAGDDVAAAAGAAAGGLGSIWRWVKSRKALAALSRREWWLSLVVHLSVGVLSGGVSMGYTVRTSREWSTWEHVGIAALVGLLSITVIDFGIRISEGLSVRGEQSVYEWFNRRFGPTPGAPANGTGQPPGPGTGAGGPPVVGVPVSVLGVPDGAGVGPHPEPGGTRRDDRAAAVERPERGTPAPGS